MGYFCHHILCDVTFLFVVLFSSLCERWYCQLFATTFLAMVGSFCHHIPGSFLYHIISLCAVFLFPSLPEGSGLVVCASTHSSMADAASRLPPPPCSFLCGAVVKLCGYLEAPPQLPWCSGRPRWMHTWRQLHQLDGQGGGLAAAAAAAAGQVRAVGRDVLK